jgi:uroporphyrinogen-III synthase
MRLLVTRPEINAGETIEQLAAAGHEALLQPMMRIEFAPQPADLIVPSAILITSANAVRALDKWSAAKDWRNLPVYAVGESTALHARDAGFRNIRIGRGDQRGLFELVRASADPKGGPLLYPTAPGVPDVLPRKLAEVGFSIFAVPAYRRHRTEMLKDEVLAALMGGKIDGALFYSRHNAAIFARLMRKHAMADGFGGVVFFVLAEQIVGPLKKLNPADIRVAEAPNEASLLDLIPAPVEPQQPRV